MKVAVLGTGNGGLAVAYEWADQGHEVALYARPEFDEQITAVRERGGITSQGALEGFAKIATATTDIAEAMAGAEVVFVVGPAYATPPLAADAGPHLREGMTVVVCPGSCVGSLAFKEAAGLDLHDETVVVGETSTLPYAVRATGEAEIRIFHRFDTGFFAAAAPRSATPKLLEVMQSVWPHTEKAESIFQTTLQNGNPVIHPAVTLLNAALIDRTHGDFTFYEEGVTPASGRLMEAVDHERQAIAKAIGVSILSEPELGVQQGYMTEANYTTGYSKAPGFLGIMAQNSLDNRYLTEDVGYTMVFFTDLARSLDVATPVMDAVIQIASIVLEHDYRAEGARTMQNMGLAGLGTEELRGF
ncbi:MAG: NAD/NADP octopine/nopaline dehydrogenase family protein [Microlunatus sp.]|nr:NAD/NADP octopine/nopaline dehydrogenase family protein [Microlunatus sp.]MDN5771528.1 NAD/NADP octopine/nopaline dehydrogenase family protein [Microlunatus sp.]